MFYPEVPLAQKNKISPFHETQLYLRKGVDTLEPLEKGWNTWEIQSERFQAEFSGKKKKKKEFHYECLPFKEKSRYIVKCVKLKYIFLLSGSESRKY